MKYIAFQSLYWLCLFYVATRKAVQASGSGLENVQGTAISYHSILVSWKSPTASFTSKQSFQITYQSRRSNSTVVRTSQHEMVLKGLKPNTNYTITVGSCLTAVDCQRKSTIVVRTKKAPQTSTPRHFQGIPVGSTRIKLSWLKPSNIVGKLRGYRITRTEGTILLSNMNPRGDAEVKQKRTVVLKPTTKYITVNPSYNETIITDLKTYTNYTFTIRAVTKFGKGKRSSSIVVRTGVAASPRVVPSHSVIFAKEGYPINLPCHYQGYSEPNVTWMFNGQRMKPTTYNVTTTNFKSSDEKNVHKVSKLLRDGSWHISSVEEDEDAGVYSCVVTNQYGIATGHVSLFVSEEPITVRFEIKLTSEVFHEELAEKDSLSFENLADNVSTAIKSLFKEAGNISIISIDVLKFRKSSVIAEMEILAMSNIEDDEHFVIKVVRERLAKLLINGTQGNLGTLKVGGLELHEPPPAPRDLRIDAVGPTTMTVSWSPPEDHVMFGVRSYTIMYRKFGAETFLAGTTTKWDVLTTKLANLKEETAYEIKVKVANNYGYAVSEPLEVKTRSVKETSQRTLPAFDSLLLVILVGVACCLVLMCIACGVLLFRRTKAYNMRAENISLELNQIEGISTQQDLQLDSPHFYMNLSCAEISHLGMVPTQYVRGESRKWQEIPRDMIRFHEDLGKGAFSEVKKGFLVKDNRTLPCAVKMLRGYATENEHRDLANELNVMANVGDHPNIISLIGACTKGGPLWIVVKLAENGNLLDYLHLHRVKSGTENNLNPETDLTYGDKLGLVHGIAKGMRHLESIKCVHRDLACRNVLLGRDNTPRISDFGLSSYLYESCQHECTEEGRLPTRWMAIESLLDYSFTSKSDVWSFGVVLWEIESAGRVPFPAMDGMEILELLLRGYRLTKPASCPNEIHDIMTTCWKADPNQRPTFQHLLIVLEEILSNTKGTSYHGNSHANDAQLEKDDIAIFFEDFPKSSVNGTPSEREHTYVNIGENCQISSLARESLTTTNPIVSRPSYKSCLLDDLYNKQDSLSRRGSLDTIISIHDLPDDPPQVPSYDRLLSIKRSPQNSPKPPSYDRLLSFRGSPKIPRCSTHVNSRPSKSLPRCAKQRQEPEQSCYDRLERWCGGIPEPSEPKEDTYDRLLLPKVFSPHTALNQSASPTVDLCGKETCHLYPELSQGLNEQGPCDEISDTAPDTSNCLHGHSGDFPSVVANDGNYNTRTDARQVSQEHSSSIPLNNRSDLHRLDNTPEVEQFSTASYDRLSIKRSFKDHHYDADSCYNRLCTDGPHTEKNSCLNGRSLQQSVTKTLSVDSNEATYYSQIRDSGIVCDDCYCEIEVSSNNSDTGEDGNVIYDTIGNENYSVSEQVERADESHAESIYATVNTYDSPTEIQQIQISSDEFEAQPKLADATVSDVVCDDCNLVDDPQVTGSHITQSDARGTKLRNLLIPDNLNTRSETQDYGEMPEDRSRRTRTLENESEAVINETAREASTTKSCRCTSTEKFTIDEKASEFTKSEKSLHDEIFEMLHDSQDSKLEECSS